MVRVRTVFAGGSWDAGSNPPVATSVFFFFHRFFYPLAFYFLFPLLTLLASRDFCENVFLVFSFHLAKRINPPIRTETEGYDIVRFFKVTTKSLASGTGS